MMRSPSRKAIVGGGLAIAVALGAAVFVGGEQYLFAAEESQFDRDTAAARGYLSDHRGRKTKSVVNADGTLHYLYEDFDSYGGVNSKLIDGMDAADRVRADGVSGALGTDSDAREGQRSIAANIDSRGGAPITLRGELSQPLDLSRWANEGYLTMWMKVADRKGISGITLVLGDAAGATRRMVALPNLQTDYPNFPTSNEPFADLAYPEKTNAAQWTDYTLAEGWNYLPWRIGAGYSQDSPGLDLKRVSWYEITLQTTTSLTRQRILLDNLRVQDGLQQDKNPVAGNWRPPLGMPQYGVYDVTTVAPGDHALSLLNVRQTQYPSNGDHAGLLSKDGTPLNFAFRTRFALNRVATNSTTNNTWLRVFYDYDPVYDPGHDWFGGYVSLDHEEFGLLTVIPLDRFSLQGQEPKERRGSHRTGFGPKQDVVYEYDLTVSGQKARATLYEVRAGKLLERGSVSYTFNRQRYGADRRYPLGIEVTGNAQSTIYSVELMEL